jgi:hypothetical protein
MSTKKIREGEKKLTALIPAELHYRVRLLSVEKDTSVKAIIVEALEEYLKKVSKK